MKQFLKKIVLFILFTFLLAYPLDIIISNQLKKSNSYARGEYSVWNDLFEGKIDSEIVIYGSSRAWVHINPELLENSFGRSSYNLGIDGHNFRLQYLRHKTLLKYNIPPKYIILSFDIWSLQKSVELYNSDQFLPYMLNNKDIIDYTSSYIGFSSLEYDLPLIRYFGNRNAAIQSIKNSTFFFQSKPKRKKGFQGMERSWSSDLSNAKTKMDFYEAKLDLAYVELFDKFLDECKQKEIKVILVYTPEYIEGQIFVKNRKEVFELYQEFSEKYKLTFLDYSNDKICKQKEYFYNSSHLNKKGADIFTKKLINDLKLREIILTK